MFCSYCGKEIADGTVYCPYCGRKLGEDAPVEKEPEQEAPEVPAEQPAVAPLETVAPEAPEAPVEQPAVASVAPVAPVAPEAPTPAPEAPAEQPAVAPVVPVAPVAPEAPAQAPAAPQPLQQTPPTSGTAPASQPVYGQAPANASYNPAAGAPKKKSAIPWIILGTIAAIGVVFGISKIIGGGSGSGSGAGAGTTVAATANGQLVDANGNPTAYAFVELSGQELSDLFEENGYKWSDSNLWWITGDGCNAGWVSGPSDYEFKQDEIFALEANGAGVPAIYALAVDDRDYASTENVFEAFANAPIVDFYWVNDEAIAAVVESSSSRRSMLLAIYDEEDELYRIHLVNPEAIDRGVLEELIGERGNSLEDIWYAYTGNKLPEAEAPAEPAPVEPSPTEGTHTDADAAAAVPSGALGAGSYRVGVDIPAGEYKIYATDEWGGYYTVYSKVGSTDYEDIVVLDAFDTCAYIHVLDGQQLDIEGASFISIDEATPTTEWLGDGVYRVGFDIPAGQYQLVSDDSEWPSYYEIRNSVETSDDYYMNSVVFDSFENNKYVNLSEGQYIMVNNCHIEQ